MANGEQTNQKWVSDIIGDDYIKWNNEMIILDCGTGQGKTHFILNVLSIYARQQKKKILYLCNRRKLYEQLINDVEKIPFITVDIILYQVLQDKINKGEIIPYYDYIIADEIHYLTSDALFNDYTDISFKYLMGQKDNGNVVIFMSATAKSFFNMLRKRKYVKPSNYYYIEKNYDYVDNVYFYKKKQLTSIIDDILNKHPEEKIIVFFNSTRYLFEMYKIYGDTAHYSCSKNNKNKKLLEICDNDCIKTYDKNYVTFEKSILFTTKVLDNGIDIKDEALKHIFTEIFDLDSAIQSLGRKRSLNSEYDTCNFYIKEYEPKAITMFLGQNEKQLNPIELLKKDERVFIDKLKKSNSLRRFSKTNKIIYTDWEDGKTEKINQIRYTKYKIDSININKMQTAGYRSVMCEWLGNDLANRVQELLIDCEERDLFLEYLKSIDGIKLFNEQKEQLKEAFKEIGLRDRTMGINTLNGKLKDCKYSFAIKSGREDSRKSDNYKKRYWIVTSTDN